MARYEREYGPDYGRGYGMRRYGGDYEGMRGFRGGPAEGYGQGFGPGGPGGPREAAGYGWRGHPRPDRMPAPYVPDYDVQRGARGPARVRRGATHPGDADRVRACDVMTGDPEVVTEDATAAQVAQRMRELDVGIIPVVDNDVDRRLRGVVTDRDLAVRVLAEERDGTTRVAECMSDEVGTVAPWDTMHTVFDVMKRHRVRRVPVTERDGRLVGIIAQADLAVQYAGLDLQRETEVEEVIERISEPAAPNREAPTGHSRVYGPSRMR